jgi:hypothetical protein
MTIQELKDLREEVSSFIRAVNSRRYMLEEKIRDLVKKLSSAELIEASYEYGLWRVINANRDVQTKHLYQAAKDIDLLINHKIQETFIDIKEVADKLKIKNHGKIKRISS